MWEYATAVAGRMLGINPFDQPDVESAKIAARGLLDARPEPAPAAFVVDGIEVRGTPDVIGASSDARSACSTRCSRQLPDDGYVSVQAYVDRVAHPELARLRDLLAADAGRPVTFGWGPRFLHSTGQFHKGGPAVGVFLQITRARRRRPRDPRPPVHLRRSSSRRRPPATRACSPTTAARCSPSRSPIPPRTSRRCSTLFG